MLDNLYSAIDYLENPADVIPCVEAIRRLVGDTDYILKDKISREVTKACQLLSWIKELPINSTSISKNSTIISW